MGNYVIWYGHSLTKKGAVIDTEESLEPFLDDNQNKVFREHCSYLQHLKDSSIASGRWFKLVCWGYVLWAMQWTCIFSSFLQWH